MREELAGAKENRAMSDALADTRASQIAELKVRARHVRIGCICFGLTKAGNGCKMMAAAQSDAQSVMG